MIAFLLALVVVAVVAAFASLAIVVGLEIRDHHAAKQPAPEPTAAPAPRIPAQRAPSAAAVVHAHDAAAFDEFLAELIVTPHVEAALR